MNHKNTELWSAIQSETNDLTDLEQIVTDPARDADFIALIESLFATLSAQTSTPVQRESARFNRRMILAELGVMTGASILADVVSGINASPLDAATKAYLVAEIDDEGLDLAHPETQAMLQSFVDSGIMAQASYDGLIALTIDTPQRFPGLKRGHIQNALQLHIGGNI